MPELPEVETVVRGLNQHLVGQTIKNIEILKPRSFLVEKEILPTRLGKQVQDGESLLVGLKVLSLSRRGKGILIHLSQNYCLLIHLKMTGQLVYVDKSARLNFGHPDPNFISTMPSRHTRVWFQLSKGKLYFNDQRLFGYIKLTTEDLLADDPFIKRLGVEPLTPDFTPTFLRDLTQRRGGSNIKSILLDQSGVVGVGNIYADEALYLAKIQPTRLGRSLTDTEISALAKAIKQVLTLGIKHSGTSISHYKTGEGATGQMQNYLNMYGRKDEPCPSCGSPIVKTRVAGRGTHYCPTCQA